MQEQINRLGSNDRINEAKIKQADEEKNELQNELSTTTIDFEARLRMQKDFFEKEKTDMKAKLKSQEKTLQSLKVNLKNSLRTRFLICKFITFISKLIKESEQAYRNSITDMQNTINKYDSKESINEAKLNQANLEKKQLEF